MRTLEAIRRRIDNARDMQSVVGAMKVLAIVSIRQFEKSLASLDDYNRAVELGLHALLADPPPGFDRESLAAAAHLPDWSGERRTLGRTGERTAAAAGRTCAIVIGSEQGLSGQFNERIAAYTLQRLSELGIGRGQRSLLTLGDHVAYRLQAAGEPVEKQFPIHGSVRTMKRTVQQLFAYFDEMRSRGGCSQILLFHHKSFSGAHHLPRMTRLYPIDPGFLLELGQRPWPARSRPAFTMDARQLLRALVRQLLRVTLERAFVESLVSENASRLVAMQVAEGNIADYLEELQREFNNQRQGEITSEILDIVAGIEAVEKAEHLTRVRTRLPG